MAGIPNAGHLPDAAPAIKRKPLLIRDPPTNDISRRTARGARHDRYRLRNDQLKMLRELMSRIVTKTIKVSTSAIPVRKAHSWPFADIGFRRTASAA